VAWNLKSAAGTPRCFFDKDKYQGPKLGFIHQAQTAE